MGDVIILDVLTTQPIPHERVFGGAAENLDPELPMVVLGYDKEGNLYVASNISSKPELVYLMEQAKLEILRMDDE